MSVVSDLLADYVMPEAHRGKVVEYFGHGRGNPIPVQARVVEVFANQLDLRLIDNNKLVDSVHHKDDPRLELNPHWQVAGTWDYTPEEKAYRAKLAVLEVRMAELDRRLKAVEAKK